LKNNKVILIKIRLQEKCKILSKKSIKKRIKVKVERKVKKLNFEEEDF
jgi:hypothetical protein